MELELENKVALVTGGSRGIGKAIALALAHEGVRVAICARTQESLDVAAKALTLASGSQTLAIVADVGVEDDVNGMVETVIGSLGRVDILVNNAGAPGGLAVGPLPTVTDAAMWEDLNVKLMGYLRCARAVVPHMVQQGWGRIINIGGMSARVPGTYSTGIRNIGIVHMSKTLSEELGPLGINVNMVHPGLTRTAFLDRILAERSQIEGVPRREIERELAAENAIRRIVEPHEIAHLVAFLASSKSIAITGEVIAASGGSSKARAVYL